MKVLLFAAAIACPAAYADDAVSTSSLPDHQILAEPPAANPSPQAVLPDMGEAAAKTPERTAANYFDNFHQGPDDYSITSVARGLSTHRPMYVLPYTYSAAYDGRHTEVVFQISAKQRLFGTNFYFGYTQKSFWQLYNKRESSPFHETDYNPELFYRWAPAIAWLNHWGTDAGFEHESNGRGLPESRSWNRIYIAPFQAKGKYLVYLKFWYRLPERRKTGPTDAEGDDNPDIQRYVGHAEFQVQRQFFDRQLAHLTVRANPATGKGSVALNYSVPSRDGSLFYCLNVFSGYGESLIDYNRPITRVGIGVMMTR
ncbi:MAG: phospholipase [Nevskiaceae bacterium]|nr:MAG: phospholipase [Nevskiaceae bacterium]